MTDPSHPLVALGLELSKLWAGYAERAAQMAPEEAEAEWQKVNALAFDLRTAYAKAADVQPDP